MPGSAQSDSLLVQVALPLPSEKLYTFSVPPSFRNKINTGMFVIVPVKKRRMVGYVMGFSREKPVSKIASISDVLFDKPVLTGQLLQLCKWMSEYYMAGIGQVLESVLPPFAKFQENRVVKAKNITKAQKNVLNAAHMKRMKQVFELVSEYPAISVKKIKKEIGQEWIYHTIRRLESAGFIETDLVSKRDIVKKGKEEWVILLSKEGRVSSKRLQILEFLERQGGKYPKKMIAQQFSGAGEILKRMRKAGMIEIKVLDKIRKYTDISGFRSFVPFQLTEEQAAAKGKILKSLLNKKFEPFFLFGVTGSGKTQVYIEIIDEIIRAGKSALYLVPEIFMSSQVISRFRFHFGDLVGVMHSRMSINERFDAWNQIRAGGTRIVIGPRSAVFAPVENLGLIIVDEEHDGAYKQEEFPYYNARDVALYRGSMEKVTVILGSATPSLESYYNVLQKKLKIVELTRRVDDSPLPDVTVIDMKEEWKKGKSRQSKMFSEFLIERMRYYLSRGEQVLIFQNRRGYSSFIQCKDCGFIDECPSCSITLTYHKDRNVMNCHYCGFTKNGFSECPSCEGSKLINHGIGTQWLEEELDLLFPEYNKLRVDADSLRKKGMHSLFSRKIEEGEGQILFGTQILAKGWDLPNLNLAGIVNADTGLFMPDFRSFERSFQLLTQVAGRAGRRDSKGEVVIQSYIPDNYALLSAREHDFISFFESEAPSRRELFYPPYGRIILVSFEAAESELVEDAAAECGRIGRGKGELGWMLGPAASPIEKLKDKYRRQIIFRMSKKKDPNGSILRNRVKEVLAELNKKKISKKVKIKTNVDPVNIM